MWPILCVLAGAAEQLQSFCLISSLSFAEENCWVCGDDPGVIRAIAAKWYHFLKEQALNNKNDQRVLFRKSTNLSFSSLACCFHVTYVCYQDFFPTSSNIGNWKQEYTTFDFSKFWKAFCACPCFGKKKYIYIFLFCFVFIQHYGNTCGSPGWDIKWLTYKLLLILLSVYLALPSHKIHLKFYLKIPLIADVSAELLPVV